MAVILGIVYLALATYVGWSIVNWFLKNCRNWMVSVPAGFVLGTLLITWPTYFLAYAFRNCPNPLTIANFIALPAFAAMAVFFYRKNKQLTESEVLKTKGKSKKAKRQKPPKWTERNKVELILTSVALVFSAFLMIYTFRVENGKMLIGTSVYSDFASHLSMIRSFSRGLNFPTNFALFPDGDIRYHFMFEFLVANLEYLGLRIDWAFNIPSIMALAGAVMALFGLAVKLTGNKAVGIITATFFWFRSSFAFETFIAKTKSLASIFTNNVFIGNTTHEDWGLWNQNVYANQRHLAFGLILLFVVIVEMLPCVKPREAWKGKGAWVVEDWKRCLSLGLAIGALSYWNGAVVLTILMVLAFMAVFSKSKLEFAVVAVITYLLTTLQSWFFVPSGASLVGFSWKLGFLAEEPTLASILSYYIEMLGIFPFMMVAGFFIIKGLEKKWMMIAFLVPLVFATTVSLTPDIAVNHKYIMMSVMLLNIFIAYVVWLLYSKKSMGTKVLAVLITVVMTVTGIVDIVTIINKSKEPAVVDDESAIISWFMENSNPRDVILTSYVVLEPITQTGRLMFMGWPYYAWSAGYNTVARDKVVKSIYEATDVGRLKSLLADNNIAFVVIDDEVRKSRDYKVNEGIFQDNFEIVLRTGGKDIYKVN